MIKHLRIPLALLGLGALVLGGVAISSNTAKAESNLGFRTFQVEITNLTRAQLFSPPLIASHSSNIDMFEVGDPASPELAELAENGNNADLAALLGGSSEVFDMASGSGMLAPGDTMVLQLDVSLMMPYISAAGMLVSTNDAFFGLDSRTCDPQTESVTWYVPAYDAGSEFNSEDCTYVPGPPCGAGAVHDPAAAEGFIYVSNGIQGIGGVPKETYDWRNNVARIKLTRL